MSDTNLMGPTRLAWKDEADQLWANRHQPTDLEVDPWRWVAIAKECLYLLSRRDAQVAALVNACKAAKAFGSQGTLEGQEFGEEGVSVSWLLDKALEGVL